MPYFVAVLMTEHTVNWNDDRHVSLMHSLEQN